MHLIPCEFAITGIFPAIIYRLYSRYSGHDADGSPT